MALSSTQVAWANNPGGFVPTVTTSVTSGTETYSTRTDHYLDNGILHVLIASNGNVDSIKYLPPGTSGTPKANGTEMVSQLGSNFNNHTAIYYYWYPDGNGDAVYLTTTGTTANMEVVCKRTYNPSTNAVPVDMEIHYALGKGNTALYVYLVANHPAGYASYGDMNISFIQSIWPGPHDANDLLCENQYLDDKIKYGLFLNGVQQIRSGLQPTLYDNTHVIAVDGFPKEISQYTSGLFSGQINGKYSYTFDYPTIGTWGLASDTKHIGLWVVAGNHDYQNNGPTACEYAGGYTGVLLFEPLIAHYDNTGLTIPAASAWTKVYGPWLCYFNNKTTGADAWQDAKNQVIAEQGAWPYSWLVNSAYQPKAQRATVTGKLVINDALRPGSSAAGAWVGLAAPDAGVENAPNNWQFQSDAFQYWVQAAADGSFTIPNVQTTSPYGGTATYKLYAYSAGTTATTGSVGEFSTGPVTIISGGTTNLGTLTWTVPHQGSQLVWEIGIPNRNATEFKHGDEYGKPGLWNQFINEFTNPLEYNVSDANWATAFNYCHSVDNMATSPWKWHINFNLTSVTQGTYYLNIAYASPSSVQVIRVNDDSTAFATFTPDNADPGASTYIRQGIHSKYSVAHVAIPWNKLHVGANTITLDHEMHSNHSTAHFMYDYIDLEAPAPTVLPPGRDLVWKGNASNAWDAAAANWVVSGTTAPAATYTDGDRPMFDDTASGSTAINLAGPATPGQMTFSNSAKSYTLAGPGTINGPMQFTKNGSGTVTVSPTQITATGTLTAGMASVSVPTAGLAVGMTVTGTGIPASDKIASIDGANALTLSQSATASGANALTFAALHGCYGGSTLNGGTVVFTNDTANTAGLGTGPITLSGGTLQMYDYRANYDTASWDLNVPTGSTGTLRADSRVDLYGSLNGGGVLNLYVPYVRTTLHGNMAGFQGQINVTAPSSGGDFRMSNSNALPKAAINLGPNVSAYSPLNAAATYPIGELSGDTAAKLTSINLGGAAPGAYTVTWSVGGRSTDAIFAGTIANGISPSVTAITKAGYGTWTLSGSCAYTGATNVISGILRITGSGSGSNSLTVSGGGALEIGNGGSLSINGAAVNYGTIRLLGNGSLQTSGAFTNYGLLDVTTSTASLPTNFINDGTVIDSSAVRVQQFSMSGGTAQFTVQSYSGHNYQLQRSMTLAAGSWANVGAAQAGNDDVLNFTDTATPSGKGFYRVNVSP